MSPDPARGGPLVDQTTVRRLLEPLAARAPVLKDAIRALPQQVQGGSVAVSYLLSIYTLRLEHVEQHVHDEALAEFTRGLLRMLQQSEASHVTMLSWTAADDEHRYKLWTDLAVTRVLLWDVFLWRQPHTSRALLLAWGDHRGQPAYTGR